MSQAHNYQLYSKDNGGRIAREHGIMTYFYHTTQGKASLNKGDGFKLVKIGTFPSESEAKKACELHYKKACKAAVNFGREVPAVAYL